MALQGNSPLYIAALLFIAIFASNVYNDEDRHTPEPTNFEIISPTWVQETISLDHVRQFVDGSEIEIPPYLYSPEMLSILSIKLQSGQLIDYPLQNFKEEPSFQIQTQKQEISSVTLKTKPIKDEAPQIRESTSRLLTYSTNSSIINMAMLVFQSVLEMSRYLLIIGLLSNSIDVFLPFIIFSECFLMMGFLNCQMYTLKDFYYNIFNSKVDIMNAIRLGMSPGPDQKTISVLSQYNFSSVIFFNLSGEFIFAIVFLAVTIFLKVGSIFINSQKLRSVKTILRPLWNGAFMALLPRVATFTGFHIRMISGTSDMVNIIICGLLCLTFLFFFIQLLLQIRGINSKIEYIQESRFDIGLASRIDHRQQFEFDCLNYSMLYYPLMNYFRLVLFFFIPIGAAYDFYYLGFGGPLLSQLLMMMIEISSPGYLLKRDKVIFPLNNFIIMLIELSIVSVGLAESVDHSQISMIALAVLFSLASLLFFSSGILTVLDFKEAIRRRCNSKQKKEDLQEDEVTQKIVRGEVMSNYNGMVKKSEMSEQIKEDCSDVDDYCITALSKKTTKVPQLKIKKVRRGRII